MNEMSFVWSQKRVEQYLGYYDDLRTHHTWAYATYSVSTDFARSLLPPCLEPAEKPAITISLGSFMEWIHGRAHRNSMDWVSAVGINARYGNEEGSYYLAAVEEDEINIVTGRELWGTPKKQGKVDFYNDGKLLYGFSERKGIRLIEFQAALGDLVEPEAGETKDIMFELRGMFGPNGRGVSGAQLVIFENSTLTHKTQMLTDVALALGTSPYDTGYAELKLGECVEAAIVGGETSYAVRNTVALDGDGHDYAPYLLGRFYDDWPDVRDTSGRVVA
jgi:acetoacetate decarboxylase